MSTTNAKSGKRSIDSVTDNDVYATTTESAEAQHDDKLADQGSCQQAFAKAVSGHCQSRLVKLTPPHGGHLYIPILPRFIRDTEAITATTTASTDARASSRHATTKKPTTEEAIDNNDDDDEEAVDVEDIDEDEENDGDDDDDDDFDIEEGPDAASSTSSASSEVVATQVHGNNDKHAPTATRQQKQKQRRGGGKEEVVVAEEVIVEDEADGDSSSVGSDRDDDVHIAGYAIDPEAPVFVYSTPSQALNHLLQHPRRRRSNDSSYGLVLCMRIADPSYDKLVFNFVPASASTPSSSSSTGRVAMSAPVGGMLAVLGSDAADGDEPQTEKKVVEANGKHATTADSEGDNGNNEDADVDDDDDDDDDDDEAINKAKEINGEYIYDSDEELSSSSDDYEDDEDEDNDDGNNEAEDDDDDEDDGDNDAIVTAKKAAEPLPRVCTSPQDFIRVVCHYGNDTFSIEDENVLLLAMNEFLPPNHSGWITVDADNVPTVRLPWETVAMWFACSTTMRATSDRVDDYYTEHKMTKNDLYMGVRPKLSEIERLDMIRRCVTPL